MKLSLLETQRSSIISTCSAVIDGIDGGISKGVIDGTTMLESGTGSEEAGAVTGVVYTSADYLSYNTFVF